MNKLFFFIFVWLSIAPFGKSQTISVPDIILSDIPFHITISNVPDSLTNITLIISNGDKTERKILQLNEGKYDSTISLSMLGKINFNTVEVKEIKKEVRSIPGFLSIVPPLIAILLALFLRQVIVALVFGVFIGCVFIYDYNPVYALMRMIDTITLNTLTDSSNMSIIVFTLLFGGVVGLISANGGTNGMANLIIRFAKTRRSGMLSSWLLGIVIFFDDYANTLIVGNLMRPITDKLKISREKLAFIVDSTSAPVTSLFIVSTWIGFEIGLIQDGLKLISSTENAYDVFLQTIPYRFYPIAMIFFVFLISFTKRDYGAMYKAEMRALNGEVVRPGSKIPDDLTETTNFLHNGKKTRWYNAVFPILFLVLGTIFGLAYTGIISLHEQGVFEFGIREIIGNSDSNKALMWSSLSSCILAILMTLSQRILNLSETIDAWFRGIRSMLLAVIILMLAWEISSVTEQIQTANYIIHMLSDSLNPRLIPVIVFIVCAVTSFSTGSSWGTMAIMMPIVIPLSHAVTGLAGMNESNSTLILHGVISSVLAGSVFGDHCSPIADTTILSSMASACDHIDHVRTQLPYALTAAIICMLVGDIPTAYNFSPYLSILIIFGLLTAVILIFGKKIELNSEVKVD
ncbi:MAG: Na+/H+ antiporter NhaC family protein [Ignavibacteria bacterium]|nr:Na+/H+ antiporter NhaC family protein [Ignavibacteria bacterium]